MDFSELFEQVVPAAGLLGQEANAAIRKLTG